MVVEALKGLFILVNVVLGVIGFFFVAASLITIVLFPFTVLIFMLGIWLMIGYVKIFYHKHHTLNLKRFWLISIIFNLTLSLIFFVNATLKNYDFSSGPIQLFIFLSMWCLMTCILSFIELVKLKQIKQP
jgi:hypothetical protein